MWEVEVTNVGLHSLWVLIGKKEYFLPHETFPRFRCATQEDVLAVELHHGSDLYWPRLDVDLTLGCLEHPAK
ncbi:DUF2442 domain-containing protein [bacterium]|nr:DUF2442 domain-containing protein [bacterium]